MKLSRAALVIFTSQSENSSDILFTSFFKSKDSFPILLLQQLILAMGDQDQIYKKHVDELKDIYFRLSDHFFIQGKKPLFGNEKDWTKTRNGTEKNIKKIMSYFTPFKRDITIIINISLKTIECFALDSVNQESKELVDPFSYQHGFGTEPERQIKETLEKHGYQIIIPDAEKIKEEMKINSQDYYSTLENF